MDLGVFSHGCHAKRGAPVNTTVDDFHGTSDVKVGPDAPDVLIAGLDVIRSIVQPTEKDEDERAWHLTGRVIVDSDGNRHLQIVGDLLVIDSGWMVGVTSGVILDFRNQRTPKRWTPAAVDKLTSTYGPWASHVLYDTAAATARRLLVMTFGSGPEISTQTPVPTILTSRDRKAAVHDR